MKGTAAASGTSPDDSVEIPPGSIALWIAGSDRRQIFEVGKEILIGRLDTANRVFPDLDLTADGGLEGGISRRHSRITFRDDTPYVEDLQSTNHTYLNDIRLEPLVPHPLQHGDELRLGSTLLRVELPQLDAEREE
jgi:pSer/pThr/pTyr-binding forkhead associated (FHA) protein